MISDFFHPVVGGVENHIYMLSAELLRRGHKVSFIKYVASSGRNSVLQVIVITHSHPPDRVGIRWLSPGIKVYHIPFVTIASSATLPEFFTFLPYFRNIILREHIQLIHAHASLSALGHEGILHAHLLGVRTVFTDHSLFGFEDAASILTNKLMVATLAHVDAAICVSHTGCVLSFVAVFGKLSIHSCKAREHRSSFKHTPIDCTCHSERSCRRSIQTSFY